MLRVLLTTFAALALSPSPASAHKVLVAFASKEDQIEVEAFFEDDVPAHQAKVKVLDDAGVTISEGITDVKGFWRFATPKNGTYVVHLDAGAGHRLKKNLIVPLVETKRTVERTGNAEPAPVNAPSTESRAEQTQTPWGRIGLGLAFIGGASGMLLLVSRMRQLKNRSDEPGA